MRGRDGGQADAGQGKFWSGKGNGRAETMMMQMATFGGMLRHCFLPAFGVLSFSFLNATFARAKERRENSLRSKKRATLTASLALNRVAKRELCRRSFCSRALSLALPSRRRRNPRREEGNKRKRGRTPSPPTFWQTTRPLYSASERKGSIPSAQKNTKYFRSQRKAHL